MDPKTRTGPNSAVFGNRPLMVGDEPNFEGLNPRECGEHRTVGPHRAWCFDCREWCYPHAVCPGCEKNPQRVSARRERVAQAIYEALGGAESWEGSAGDYYCTVANAAIAAYEATQ